MNFLRQSTDYTFRMGPFVDSTDGNTEETALTILATDVKISKDGGAFASKTEATAPVHDANGFYSCLLDETDTASLGQLRVFCHPSGALPVWHNFMVLPASTYDSLVLGDAGATDLVFSASVTASRVAICNMALSHIGVGKEINNLESDTSQEAAACRRFFDIARDATLRAYWWPFATKIQDLALVEEDPTDEYAYAYRYPSDCLAVRRILSGIRQDSRQSRVTHKITRDATGELIYTDVEDAQIEYTFRENDTTRYQADFVLAFSYMLASLIAPRLTAGDPFKLGDKALNMYSLTIRGAQANATNEEQPDEDPDSEFIRGR